MGGVFKKVTKVVKSIGKGIVNTVKNVLHGDIKTILSLAVAIVCPFAGAAIATTALGAAGTVMGMAAGTFGGIVGGAVGGAVSSAINGGNVLKGALMGAATSAIMAYTPVGDAMRSFGSAIDSATGGIFSSIGDSLYNLFGSATSSVMDFFGASAAGAGSGLAAGAASGLSAGVDGISDAAASAVDAGAASAVGGLDTGTLNGISFEAGATPAMSFGTTPDSFWGGMDFGTSTMYNPEAMSFAGLDSAANAGVANFDSSSFASGAGMSNNGFSPTGFNASNVATPAAAEPATFSGAWDKLASGDIMGGLSTGWDSLGVLGKGAVLLGGGYLLSDALKSTNQAYSSGNDNSVYGDGITLSSAVGDLAEKSDKTYNTRFDLAMDEYGMVPYYNPHYQGTLAQNEELISGTNAKNSAIRNEVAQGRVGAADAEARRYNTDTAKNATNAYTNAYNKAAETQSQKIKNSWSMIPDADSSTVTAILNAAEGDDKSRQRLVNMFGSIYGLATGKNAAATA